MDRNSELAKLFAKHFITRTDVKARQSRFGTYAPVHKPWVKSDLIAHLEGRTTYGHYMVGLDDTTKLFALDVDLEQLQDRDKPGYRPMLLPTVRDGGIFSGWEEMCPRTTWMSREPGPAREFIRLQMHTIAHLLVKTIEDELEIKAIASYSGSKGIHVYGLTGRTSATLARQAAQLVVAEAGWELFRGKNVYTYKAKEPWEAGDPMSDFHQFTLEVYPKQDSLEGKEKGLGNLIRLPLGVNHKSPRKDKPFFIDLRTPMNDLAPLDPIEALTTTNIWAYAHEL